MVHFSEGEPEPRSLYKPEGFICYFYDTLSIQVGSLPEALGILRINNWGGCKPEF